MSVLPDRDGHRPRGVPGVRAGLALLGVVALMLVSACGMGAQTLRPYTPAEGVNFDVGDGTDPESVVHVRNLLIISREAGSGIVSASIVTTGSDTLTGISGQATKAGGVPGTTFTAALPAPIPLLPNAQVVLTNRSPFITVESPDLQAGLTADVTVTFAGAGSYTTRTTVVDGNLQPYTTISASPSGTPSPVAPATTPQGNA